MENDNVIYSCVTGGYDFIPELTYKMAGWDYILYTDSYQEGEYNGWIVKPLQHLITGEFDCNTRTARWHKINPHLLFPEYIYSLWVDSNIRIDTSGVLDALTSLIQGDVKISSIKHPQRVCVYDEGAVCVALGKDARDVVTRQLNVFKKDGFPEDFGLFETNVLLRLHNDEVIKKINEDWWDIISVGSKRDQLSFTYVLWKNELECSNMFNGKFSARDFSGFNFIGAHKKNNLIRRCDYQKKICLIIEYASSSAGACSKRTLKVCGIPLFSQIISVSNSFLLLRIKVCGVRIFKKFIGKCKL